MHTQLSFFLNQSQNHAHKFHINTHLFARGVLWLWPVDSIFQCVSCSLGQDLLQGEQFAALRDGVGQQLAEDISGEKKRKDYSFWLSS